MIAATNHPFLATGPVTRDEAVAAAMDLDVQLAASLQSRRKTPNLSVEALAKVLTFVRSVPSRKARQVAADAKAARVADLKARIAATVAAAMGQRTSSAGDNNAQNYQHALDLVDELAAVADDDVPIVPTEFPLELNVLLSRIEQLIHRARETELKVADFSEWRSLSEWLQAMLADHSPKQDLWQLTALLVSEAQLAKTETVGDARRRVERLVRSAVQTGVLATGDSHRLQALADHMENDGFGWWLPSWCVKEGDGDSDRPTITDLRAFIRERAELLPI